MAQFEILTFPDGSWIHLCEFPHPHSMAECPCAPKEAK